MVKRNFTSDLGKKVRLSLPETGKKEFYDGIIMKATGSSLITIGISHFTSDMTAFKAGREVAVSLFSGDGIYKFTSQVEDFSYRGILREKKQGSSPGSFLSQFSSWKDSTDFNMPALVIRAPMEISRQHKRKFKRVGVDIPVYYFSLPRGFSFESADFETLYMTTQKQRSLGQIRNLSGGGVFVSVKEKLEEDSTVKLEFIVPGAKEFSGDIYAKIISGRLSPGSEYPFAYSCEFTSISENDREIIIKYTYGI